MSESLQIIGGKSLRGEVQISGAKNAALPMLIASLLSSEPVEFENVPALEDTTLTLSLLEHFGTQVFHSRDKVRVHTPKLIATEASYSLVKALRASFWVLGPLLARGGAARVALPGGDLIGARPVDLHVAALEQMGATITVKHGVVYATAPQGLKPATIQLRFPSVGATHQIIMAASLVPGRTVIQGAAREPEIVAVAELINAMGGCVEGAGSATVVIEGKKSLGSAKVRIIGDRIEAGTYLLAACVTGGEVTARGIAPEFLTAFLERLEQMGVTVTSGEDYITVKAPPTLTACNVTTEPFPGFPTDLQAPMMAALSLASGESKLDENIFEGRFRHATELNRMGANISVEGRSAHIVGVDKLSGAEVEGSDIRAAAALVVAGLAAQGVCVIHEIQHLRRGYEALEEKLSNLGAEVRSTLADSEDYLYAGC